MDTREKFRSFRRRDAPRTRRRNLLAEYLVTRIEVPGRNRLQQNGGAEVPHSLFVGGSVGWRVGGSAESDFSRLAVPPRSTNLADLEVIDERATVIGLPDAARRVNWILGRNFGASAGATRRGHGGEIYSRVSAASPTLPENPLPQLGDGCANYRAFAVILHKSRQAVIFTRHLRRFEAQTFSDFTGVP